MYAYAYRQTLFSTFSCEELRMHLNYICIYNNECAEKISHEISLYHFH